MHYTGFWKTDRVNSLLPNMVTQLENVSGGVEAFKDRVREHIVPCLGQLAVTVSSDTLWKPMNNQVLMRTREDSPHVRMAALQVIGEFYSRLGEEFLILLPETIPFLAELMEGKPLCGGGLGVFWAIANMKYVLTMVACSFLFIISDDDIQVEKLTQEVIAQIETFLGESLQQYFK